ncbi:Uncharacterized protein APZ42_019473 [Daphnia magna]|uniref:Uncharacterized protein n=1 Tax=Daphnia magna TaxID=35525 RepID=A0A164Y6E7_9CRUS|nr:Uncharacterized protein APZ42_019473 [Daphnia magna]
MYLKKLGNVSGGLPWQRQHTTCWHSIFLLFRRRINRIAIEFFNISLNQSSKMFELDETRTRCNLEKWSKDLISSFLLNKSAMR